ncbi:hypothetical protein PCASD_17235 [Puccinia coronata f. sp. avenae]|uniref:Uncharacterized protein n=1 Tax=Puccinia coronata f. sp. avenae TaxID=200324 RepID=A0A2N5T9R3_9BASI|nr:hypothetical protein PCASD_17235 [Puccinia coronata f. sp. avenae]
MHPKFEPALQPPTPPWKKLGGYPPQHKHPGSTFADVNLYLPWFCKPNQFVTVLLELDLTNTDAQASLNQHPSLPFSLYHSPALSILNSPALSTNTSASFSSQFTVENMHYRPLQNYHLSVPLSNLQLQLNKTQIQTTQATPQLTYLPRLAPRPPQPPRPRKREAESEKPPIIPTIPPDDSNDEPRCPIPKEELLKLGLLELRKVAQEYSKQAMSQEDKDFFIALHQQQEIEQAVAAIERGVSLSMVFAILGWRIAIKEANRWNQFLQTDQARFIFQQSGLGVKDKGVMKQLSAAYALLSEEEKAALSNQPSHADPTSENAANDGNDKDNIPVQAPSVNTNMV